MWKTICDTTGVGAEALLRGRKRPRSEAGAAPAAASRPVFDDRLTVFVKNVPFAYDQAGFQAIFREVEGVGEARLVLDRHTGRSRGFGYVTFASRAGLEAAVALNGTIVGGKSLYVAESKPPTGPRSSGAARGGGRGRGGQADDEQGGQGRRRRHRGRAGAPRRGERRDEARPVATARLEDCRDVAVSEHLRRRARVRGGGDRAACGLRRGAAARCRRRCRDHRAPGGTIKPGGGAEAAGRAKELRERPRLREELEPGPCVAIAPLARPAASHTAASLQAKAPFPRRRSPRARRPRHRR